MAARVAPPMRHSILGTQFLALLVQRRRPSRRPVEGRIFSRPFVRLSRLDLMTDFGMGVSWNWKEFDGRQRPATVLGSDSTPASLGCLPSARQRPGPVVWVRISPTDERGMVQPGLGSTPSAQSVPQYDLAPGTSISSEGPLRHSHRRGISSSVERRA